MVFDVITGSCCRGRGGDKYWEEVDQRCLDLEVDSQKGGDASRGVRSVPVVRHFVPSDMQSSITPINTLPYLLAPHHHSPPACCLKALHGLRHEMIEAAKCCRGDVF